MSLLVEDKILYLNSHIPSGNSMSEKYLQSGSRTQNGYRNHMHLELGAATVERKSLEKPTTETEDQGQPGFV